ncbi:hypothetical protein HDV64DRAFT_241799 [Trichoderma sp. TUCIM 5745]
MCVAGITDVDCALLNVVARSSVCRAAVNGVLVVEAAASRVEFNKLITHGSLYWCGSKSIWRWSTNWTRLHPKTLATTVGGSKQMKVEGSCLPLLAVG